MIENATSASSIQSMLRTMAAFQSEAAGGLQGLGAPNPGLQVPSTPAAPGFGAAVERALEQVNAAQQKAKGLREAYETGEPVPLTDVVIQMQKASLAFEATLQVRNKVMKAYEDILNMPV
ncbi:MAG: flagellar hook-basal body complex protein FliE [Betaproteobacteria bacterium]